MKQHVFLISAYRLPDHLNKMLSRYADTIPCYIHLDRKSAIRPSELFQHPNVHIYQTYKINWGGINHWLAFLDLMRKAVSTGYDYYHLITGQDYVVAPLTQFDTLMDGVSHVNSDWIDQAHWTPTQFYDRYNVYHFYDQINVKHPIWGSFFWKTGCQLAKLQRKLGINRPMPLKVYAGNGYCSLTHEAVCYILNYLDENPDFLRRMKHTFCAEEIMFPTILMNSPLRDKISNDCLHFISWKGPQPPRTLDASDFAELTSGKYLFARKIDPVQSAQLTAMIDSYLGFS